MVFQQGFAFVCFLLVLQSFISKYFSTELLDLKGFYFFQSPEVISLMPYVLMQRINQNCNNQNIFLGWPSFRYHRGRQSLSPHGRLLMGLLLLVRVGVFACCSLVINSWYIIVDSKQRISSSLMSSLASAVLEPNKVASP